MDHRRIQISAELISRGPAQELLIQAGDGHAVKIFNGIPPKLKITGYDREFAVHKIQLLKSINFLFIDLEENPDLARIAVSTDDLNQTEINSVLKDWIGTNVPYSCH